MRSYFLTIVVGILTSGMTVATEVKSFCEYGLASAVSIGAGGAEWTQVWGEDAWDWYDCRAQPDKSLLHKDVRGLQRTLTSGAPLIDGALLLHLPFSGTITLTAFEHGSPEEPSGTLVGEMTGVFVADLNATHAVIDEATITIRFGAPLHSGPDALIQVTETTGKFEKLHAEGSWEWWVSGSLTIARVPALSPQVNIFAALGRSELILGATEEVVLSGSYSHAADRRESHGAEGPTLSLRSQFGGPDVAAQFADAE